MKAVLAAINRNYSENPKRTSHDRPNRFRGRSRFAERRIGIAAAATLIFNAMHASGAPF